MAGVRPSSDKPVEAYYFQPWWIREAIRLTSILGIIDFSALSDKDMKSLVALSDKLKALLDSPQ